MNDRLALPPSRTDEIRQLVLERFAAIFEAQTRNHLFACSITELIDGFHEEFLAGLEDILIAADAAQPSADVSYIAGQLRQQAQRCRRLGSTMTLLTDRWRRQHDRSGQGLQEILLEFNRMANALNGTLVERDLLERQSRVLESIVLSHEKVAQWKSYVQELLAGFHSVLPFQVFLIAFVEAGSLQLYLYYLGQGATGDHEDHGPLREGLVRDMLARFRLGADAPVSFEEFTVEQAGVRQAQADLNPDPPDPNRLHLMTVPIPSLDASDTPGMLGVVTSREGDAFSTQESSVIQSLLAVMVMIVGSSRTLNRTLSELEYYSSHDPLTGLYNRRYFDGRLSHEIERSTRHRHEFAILFIDLDDFKDINDTYGHPCGDRVLRQVGDTLNACVRQGDLVTRIGGDEFAVVLIETGAVGSRVVAEKILEELRTAIFSDDEGKRFHVTCSIGMAVFPQDGRTASDLMAGVDVGLYMAKELGKDSLGAVSASPGKVQSSRDNRDYAEDLRLALLEGRAIPYFQPILHCDGSGVFGFETLARIIDVNGEIITAGRFIETIEKYGLGRELDRTIISQALSALRSQLASASQPMRLFINLSAQEIQSRGILGFAEQLCAELGIPPGQVVFEILERAAIVDIGQMQKFLGKLKDKGFLFALDDFGSGYNAFHYLKALPFDFVKIDGAFVRNILNSRIDFALVHNLTRLCQDIGAQTVAEYVESDEVLQALREMGVDYVQGFHMGMPMPWLRPMVGRGHLARR
jgi:diguanylate cyclase (GGDEF)-like protein